MKFICAGLHKTGTKSIAYALRALGFTVWDFDEQLLHYADEWLDLFENDKPIDFYSMYKDVDAIVDYPGNYFYEEIMDAFPEAKVILSVREDENAWSDSYKNQMEIIHYSYLTKIRPLIPTYAKAVGVLEYFRMAALGHYHPSSTLISRKRFREHNERVKSVVPKEKLLVYSVKQGWKPLCEFTGKSIPKEPFPYLNVRGSIFYTFQKDTELGRKIVGEVKIVMFAFIVLVVILGVLLSKLFVLY